MFHADLDHPLTRRALLAVAGRTGGAAALAALVAGGWAAKRSLAREDRRDATLEDERRRAIQRGCAFLADRQMGPEQGEGYFGKDQNAVVALTALAVLALMANGSTDGRGPYGENVRRGLDFLLHLVQRRSSDLPYPEGYFYHKQDRSSRMHGQGYATLALATALGTSTGRRYQEIRAVLEKAVACIEQSQTLTGGFGYEPDSSGDHEGSVTVTVAQGLRAARDAGLVVDQNVVAKGLHYLKRSQNADGSFRYAVYVDRPSYALTAAAISSFFLYGKYVDEPGDDTIQRGVDYMMRRLETVMRTGRWYYYGHFYAAWALWQKDGSEWDPRSGGYWARWHRRVYPDLIDKQRRSDGGWSDQYDQFGFDDVLPTSFAVLTLSIPDEGIPLFQR